MKRRSILIGRYLKSRAKAPPVKKGKPERSDDWSLQDKLDLLKTLVLIFAGLWSIFLFFSFERQQNTLNLELLRLQTALADSTAQKSKLDLEAAQSNRIHLDPSIQIQDLGPLPSGEHAFFVSFEYQISNTGSASYTVTYIHVEAFLANLSSRLSGSSPSPAVEVGDFRGSVGLSWEPVFSKGFYHGPKWDERDPSKFGPFRMGGGGTSVLDAGEKSKGSIELALRGEPKDVIGFQLRLGIDGGKVPADRWKIVDKAILNVEKPLGD